MPSYERVLPAKRNVKRYAVGVTAAALLAVLFWPAWGPALFGRGRFLPHSFCYLQEPRLIWTNAVTDSLIGLSYVAISVMLTLLVHRSRRDIPFSWVFLAFGMFIIACGGTHFMEVLVLWQPFYWMSAGVKIVTAVASVATAFVLPPLIPKALAMVQAAKKSEERRIQLQERLEALERERVARAEAEEASRAKDAFLATLSHELRTPMTAILGWASMLRGGELDAETQKVGIQAIDQSARAQAQLIDDLLDVSRIIAGKLALEPRSIDLCDVVRSGVQTVALMAERQKLTLQVILPPEPVAIVADAARLHQVVTNLLSNAIKFTPEGGRVEVALERERQCAVITVSDTGIGVEPDFLPHVFDRFTQADPSVTRSYAGLGLGLAIVRHLTELHGGSVAVESDGEGKGSRFSVRLPLAASDTEPKHEPVRDDTGVNLEGVKVLLVEDEPMSRDMMAFALNRHGATVRVASSVSQALELLGQERPDVIVTDIAMPGEDGFALLRAVRMRSNALPVVAVSAVTGADERSRIRLAGFDEFLQKPVQPRRLARAVAEQLRA